MIGAGRAAGLDFPAPHFPWPEIDAEVERAVMRQLADSVSIYDKSGVFERFEKKFASYHGLEYGLLFNSGTTALFAVYEALGLRPGDQVICPDYTFFATASPLEWMGVTVVLCDCDIGGGLSVDALARAVTDKTKAVVVTHMWGIPAEIHAIASFCERRGIKLIEDCSHAHGATAGSQLVGTFGHVAIWSLQAQKLVSAGEGGVVATNSQEIYERLLLIGHYNKRCRQEISTDSANHRYSSTGYGLKLRAHPLGIAMAEVDLERLPQRLKIKQEFASELLSKLLARDYQLILPLTTDRKPSWYAFNFVCMPLYVGRAERIFDELHKRGAADFDMPRSTGSLARLPLFRDDPSPIVRQGRARRILRACENSQMFSDNSIKVSVPWDHRFDELWRGYVDTLIEVLERDLNGEFR